MVVARKAPTNPAPTGSRAPSSQAVPKLKKTAPPLKPSPPPPPLQTNASVKRSHKRDKRRRDRSRSWSQQFFFLLVGIFAVYSFSVCPTDHPRTSLVCHSLDYYRSYVLDPYLVPPIRSLIRQAEPHVAPLKPYVSPVVAYSRRNITPRLTAVAYKSTKVIRLYILPIFHRYYHQHLKVHYYARIHPRILPYIRPYVAYYHQHILPTLHTTSVHAHTTYTRVGPPVRKAFQMAKSYALHAYTAARPYTCKAWAVARPYLWAFGEALQARAVRLVKTAGKARRVYVDPHLIRIWEQAAEKRAKVKQESDSSTDPAVNEEPVLSSAGTSEKMISTSMPGSSSSIQSQPPHYEIKVSPVPQTEHEAASAASVVSESLHPLSIDVEATASATKAEPAASAASESHSSPSSHTSAEASATAGNGSIDDFLRDIGIGSNGEDNKADGINSAQEEEVEHEETKAEENEEQKPNFRGRSDIEARHAKWERELQELVEKTEAEVRRTLEDLRAEAVAELARYDANARGQGQDQQSDGGSVYRGVVEAVEEEAGRLMKGLEGYARGLEGRIKALVAGNQDNVAMELEREGKTWERVMEKTEERFAGRVRQIQLDVNGWYLKVREQEREEVDKAADKVKNLAQSAQIDLAFDYVWLEDASYEDWERYHDLIRVSENFTTFALALQSRNYSAPAALPARKVPLEDLLLAAMTKVEADVNEISEGFKTLLKDVGRKTGRVLREAEKLAIERDQDATEKVGGENKSHERKVSILPVEPRQSGMPIPGSDTTDPEDLEGVEQVLLGRSKEEVEEKLKAAGSAGVRVVTSSTVDERDEL